MKRFALVVLLYPVLLAPKDSFAQWEGPDIPDSVSVQGLLTDTGGDPAADGNYYLVFKLYKNSSAVWTESHTDVPVTNGVFNVILGGTTELKTLAFN